MACPQSPDIWPKLPVEATVFPPLCPEARLLATTAEATEFTAAFETEAPLVDMGAAPDTEESTALDPDEAEEEAEPIKEEEVPPPAGGKTEAFWADTRPAEVSTRLKISRRVGANLISIRCFSGLRASSAAGRISASASK
jgi:hypothetical protein